MRKYKFINKPNYIRWMYKDKLPIKEIAEKFGVTISGIVDFRIRNHLPARGWSKPPWLGKKRNKETIEKIKNSRTGKCCGIKNHAWKGGYYVASGGYKRILKKDHFGKKDVAGYVLEHRYVIEKFINRKLENNEIIHHINGNKLDNRIENLEIINRSNHGKTHWPKGAKFGINYKHTKHENPKFCRNVMFRWPIECP